PQRQFQTTPLAASYDHLVFVDSSTATRLLDCEQIDDSDEDGDDDSDEDGDDDSDEDGDDDSDEHRDGEA
ncbi:MAG: hypothetical protein ABEH80_01660, partial [Halobaculum sp.]